MVETELFRDVPSETKAVSRVRREVAGWLLASGVPEDECAEWALVVAELASNAYENSPTGTEFSVVATCSEDRITVKVTNTSDGHHVPRVSPAEEPYAESGRGLRIVRALTDGLVFEVSGETVRATCWRQRPDVTVDA